MSASILNEAYVYMATTTDWQSWEDVWNENKKYPMIDAMQLYPAAMRFIQKNGICIKIGSTTQHPDKRAYQLQREKGLVMIHVQTLHTTPSGLLLAESLLRQLLENHPATTQIGTDTFQVKSEEDRAQIIAQWNKWIMQVMTIINTIK